MKSCLLALFTLLATPAFAQPRVSDAQFDSVPDFLRLPLDGRGLEDRALAINHGPVEARRTARAE